MLAIFIIMEKDMQHKLFDQYRTDVALITQTKVKPDKQEEFEKWQARVDNVLTQYPGYKSHTVIAPNTPNEKDWVIIQRFSSVDAAKNWLSSSQLKELLKEVENILIGKDDIFIFNEDESSNFAATVIASNEVDPAYEKEFLLWHDKAEKAQAKFPGYLSSKLEKPQPGIGNAWITIIRFDSGQHLENWLSSNERAALLEEAKNFYLKSHIRKVNSGFNFWFQSKTGQQLPAVWKGNMLVLLALYPTIFLYSYFIDKPFIANKIPFYIALFIGNAFSTVILGCFAVPSLNKAFRWWLSNNKKSALTDIVGAGIILGLYALLVFIFSRIKA